VAARASYDPEFRSFGEITDNNKSAKTYSNKFGCKFWWFAHTRWCIPVPLCDLLVRNIVNSAPKDFTCCFIDRVYSWIVIYTISSHLIVLFLAMNPFEGYCLLISCQYWEALHKGSNIMPAGHLAFLKCRRRTHFLEYSPNGLASAGSYILAMLLFKIAHEERGV
jgi:hypothetical protein